MASRVARPGSRARARAPGGRRWTSTGSGAATRGALTPPPARTSSSSRTVSVGWAARVLAREREQVVARAAPAAGVGLDLGDRLRVAHRAARGSRRCRAAPSAACAARARRRRRSAARPRARARALASIAFSVAASSPTSSRTAGSGRRRAASPVRSISAAAPDSRRSGRSAPPRQRRDRERAQRGGREPAPTTNRCRLDERLLEVVRRARDDHRAARGRAAHAPPAARRRRGAARRRSSTFAKPGRLAEIARSMRLLTGRTRPPSALERATIRPRRSTTSTSSRFPATGESSAPGVVSSRGRRGGQLRDLDRSAPQRHRRASGADGARRAGRSRRRRRRPRARSQPPPRRPTRIRSESRLIVEHEADAAHGVDQRRLAELAPQVGDVAVDRRSSRLRLRRPTPARAPARASRPAARFRSSSSSRSASRGLSSSSRSARRAVRALTSSTRSPWAISSPGASSPAEQRSHAGEQLVARERLHEVVVGAGVEARDAVVDRVARGQHQDRKPRAPVRARRATPRARRGPASRRRARSGPGRAARSPPAPRPRPPTASTS